MNPTNDLNAPSSTEIALARLTVAVADLAQTMSGGYASVAVRLEAIEARLRALETSRPQPVAQPKPEPIKPQRARKPASNGIPWPPSDATLDALLTAYIDGPDCLTKLTDDCGLPRSAGDMVRQYARRTGRLEQYQQAVARSRELGKVHAVAAIRQHHAERKAQAG